jgi:hypothetical protein
MWSFGISQIVGIILSVSILLGQWYFGVFPRDLTRANLLSVFFPYIGLFLLFAVFHILGAPAKLDARLRSELAAKTSEIESLRLNPLEEERCKQVAEKMQQLSRDGSQCNLRTFTTRRNIRPDVHGHATRRPVEEGGIPSPCELQIRWGQPLLLLFHQSRIKTRDRELFQTKTAEFVARNLLRCLRAFAGESWSR